MSTDVIVALTSTVLTTVIAVYAICDTRKEAKKMIKLGRDLAYLKIKNDMTWAFIDPTESAHSPQIAKGLHEFGLLAQALDPGWTSDAIKSAVENEALEFAEELVRAGRATWKAGLDSERVRMAIEGWRSEKNVERVKKLMD